MNRVAVLILTFNEELQIGACIDSAKFADEIVVVDSGSTDKTVEIAQAKGARIVYHPWKDFAAQRNFALTCTDAEWVFYVDADEVVTLELADEIRGIVAKNEEYAWRVPRRGIIYGKWVRYGGFYPDYTLRLFPKAANLCWEGEVHEKANVSVPVKNLRHDIIHNGFHSWHEHLGKDNYYTTLWAERAYNEGKRANLWDIIAHPAWAFFRLYILRGGWREGTMGFILAWFRFFYVMMKYVKLYHYEQKWVETEKRG